jgi:hypothetical protein
VPPPDQITLGLGRPCTGAEGPATLNLRPMPPGSGDIPETRVPCRRGPGPNNELVKNPCNEQGKSQVRRASSRDTGP